LSLESQDFTLFMYTVF